jgi:maltooligosyltrehalose trehalohydrolase
LPDPSDDSSFEACKLNHDERRVNTAFVELHRDLIELRKNDTVFRAQRSDWLHGAILGPQAFALRFFGAELGDRIVALNLGRDLYLMPLPEPLLAPPESASWRVIWSSEVPKYGGYGHDPVDSNGIWRLPGESAVVLTSESL